MLKEDDPHIKSRAARCLGYIGKKASKAIPALQNTLHYEDLEVRIASAEALGKIGQESLPVLINALEEFPENASITLSWIIKALTDINIKTEKLTFLLNKLSNNTNTNISLLASMAIEKLNHHNHQVSA